MKSRVDKMKELVLKFDNDIEALHLSHNISSRLIDSSDHAQRKRLQIQLLDLQKALCRALGKVGSKTRI